MRILFVIDTVHETGGAHVATRLLIRELLKRGYEIGVVGCTDPTEEQRQMLSGVRFYRCFSESGLWGWFVRRLDWHVFHCGIDIPCVLDPLGCARRLMRRYDTVCVMSEGSIFRRMVGALPTTVRKVQLIHINYPEWARMAHRDIVRDIALYEKMDAIGCVGQIAAEQFEQIARSCSGRVFSFYNIIDFPRMKERSESLPLVKGPVRLVTLARITDYIQKDGPRMVRVAQKLKEYGVAFVWDVYGGGGAKLEELRMQVRQLGLSDELHLHGHNTQARERLGEADIFVLLSHFEGLPNVIYEALMAGVPVFATAVGGVPEQIVEGKTGWLVEDEEGLIVEKLVTLLRDSCGILSVREEVGNYRYDNCERVSGLVRALSRWGCCDRIPQNNKEVRNVNFR